MLSQRSRLLLIPVSLVLLGELGLRYHGDVLGAKPVRAAGRDSLHRHSGAGIGELGIAFEIAALGGRQRRSSFIALAVIDDSELVPGERILVVTDRKSTR